MLYFLKIVTTSPPHTLYYAPISFFGQEKMALYLASMLMLIVGAVALPAQQELLDSAGVMHPVATGNTGGPDATTDTACFSISPGASDFWCQTSCGTANPAATLPRDGLPMRRGGLAGCEAALGCPGGPGNAGRAGRARGGDGKFLPKKSRASIRNRW